MIMPGGVCVRVYPRAQGHPQLGPGRGRSCCGAGRGTPGAMAAALRSRAA
jgi:hypothetical protein